MEMMKKPWVDKWNQSAIIKNKFTKEQIDMVQQKKNVSSYFFFYFQGFYFSAG